MGLIYFFEKLQFLRKFTYRQCNIFSEELEQNLITVLHIAAKRGHFALMMHLVEKGADIKKRNNNGDLAEVRIFFN